MKSNREIAEIDVMEQEKSIIEKVFESDQHYWCDFHYIAIATIDHS